MENSVSAASTNADLIGIIRKAEYRKEYSYRGDDLRREKISFLAENCRRVIDFGKSSRGDYPLFREGQAVTVDINRFEGYPDIVDDICEPRNLAPASADGIVCLAVLEHVYDPIKAVANLHDLLEPGGYCFAYLPFLYRYHAPRDLVYQDYFRFTRDGAAYLFRNFEQTTIYPYRGAYSTIANIWQPWKYRVEKIFGQGLNRWLDRIGGMISNSPGNDLQVSGFYVWARKKGGGGSRTESEPA